MTDSIAEMLTRIRNAQRAGKKDVFLSPSNLKLAIGKILEKECFVESVSKEKEGEREKIRIVLKYNEISRTQKTPAITGLRRVSREGQRIYVDKKNIKSVKNNYGIGIISTSQGVMTNSEAKKNGLGGEYLCEVW
jgi:small subunit ribosomal protein S8